MNKKINQLILFYREDIKLFLSVSFGISLFILFFEPFPLERFDINDRLIFVAGLGAIILLFMLLIRFVFHWPFRNNDQNKYDFFLPSFLGGLTFLVLASVAFAFYLRYVGLVSISFYAMFKIILICTVPPVILNIYDTLKALRKQNELLIQEKKSIQKQVKKYEEDYLNKSVEFLAENSKENLTFFIADVAFIKSADNYVEIIFKDGGTFRKKLLRNTLKNIEIQIKSYSNFVRCHRTCIVNTHFIEKLNRNLSHSWLTLRACREQIPVSRQYLLKIREVV